MDDDFRSSTQMIIIIETLRSSESVTHRVEDSMSQDIIIPEQANKQICEAVGCFTQATETNHLYEYTGSFWMDQNQHNLSNARRVYSYRSHLKSILKCAMIEIILKSR